MKKFKLIVMTIIAVTIVLLVSYRLLCWALDEEYSFQQEQRKEWTAPNQVGN